MRRRNRSRRRGGPQLLSVAFVVLVVLGAGAAMLTPAQSYTTATVERGAAADVVIDEDAVLSLDLASSVTTGATEKLVNVTNYVGQSVTVTVQVSDGSESYGDLVVDGTNVGDATSFSLADTASQRVDFSVPCDDSLGGKSVSFSVDISGDGVSGSATRSVDITADCEGGLVYATPSARDLRTVRNDTGVTRYDATDVQVIAPHGEDLDADGRPETAFVNGSTGDIYAIDEGNETTQLLDASALSGVLEGGAETSKSKMAVGTWNGGEPSVFFVNDTESGIFRVDDDEHVAIVKASNGASAALGVEDIDGDGVKEIVFLDGSSQLRYVEEDGATIRKIQNGGAGSNNGVGAGEPADFDGDGVLRVPFVDGSGYLSLVTHDGNKTVLTNDGNNIVVDKAPVAPFDWDGDGRPEIIVLDGGVLHVVDNVGGNVTVTEITSGGSGIDAAPEPGPA